MSPGGALATEIEIVDVEAFNADLERCRQLSGGVPRMAWLILAHVDGDMNKVQVFGQNSGVLATVAGWRQRLVPDRILYSLLNISFVEQDVVISKYVYVRWIGENVPSIRKAKCGVAQASIKRMFQPYHLLVETSSLADLKEEEIRLRLGGKSGGMHASLVINEAARLPLRPSTFIDGLGVANDLTLAISQARESNGAVNWVIAAFKDYAACKALSLVAKGFGRIEPLKEHLDESQVMYVLLRVNATKDSCPTTKMLLVKWMGGEVKPLARGQRTQFPGAVEKAFSPFHASISCTGLEEFTEEHVSEKVQGKLGADIAISW